MPFYTAQEGDCLSSIAQAHGLSNYQIIYQRPENADFRNKRPNPNILCAGDVLFIPDLELKEIPKGTGQRHVFEVKQSSVKLRLCLKDEFSRPYKNTKYRLRVGNTEWDGSTDGAGLLEKDIEADDREGKITIFPWGGNRSDESYTFSLQLGDLDPVDEMSGVDARLLNLGFGPSDANGILSEEDRTGALRAFQKEHGLEVTGKLTAETRSKLRESHDGE